MSIHRHAQTTREVWLLAAGRAAGARDAVLRNARNYTGFMRGILAREARSWNREVLVYLRRARDFT